MNEQVKETRLDALGVHVFYNEQPKLPSFTFTFTLLDVEDYARQERKRGKFEHMLNFT